MTIFSQICINLYPNLQTMIERVGTKFTVHNDAYTFVTFCTTSICSYTPSGFTDLAIVCPSVRNQYFPLHFSQQPYITATSDWVWCFD